MLGRGSRRGNVWNENNATGALALAAWRCRCCWRRLFHSMPVVLNSSMCGELDSRGPLLGPAEVNGNSFLPFGWNVTSSWTQIAETCLQERGQASRRQLSSPENFLLRQPSLQFLNFYCSSLFLTCYWCS